MRIGKVVALALIIVAVGTYLLAVNLLGAPAATSTTTASGVTPNRLCKGHAKCWAGTVNWIADGDTLEVGSIRIRRALIDVPEQGQPVHPFRLRLGADMIRGMGHWGGGHPWFVLGGLGGLGGLGLFGFPFFGGFGGFGLLFFGGFGGFGWPFYGGYGGYGYSWY